MCAVRSEGLGRGSSCQCSDRDRAGTLFRDGIFRNGSMERQRKFTACKDQRCDEQGLVVKPRKI